MYPAAYSSRRASSVASADGAFVFDSVFAFDSALSTDSAFVADSALSTDSVFSADSALPTDSVLLTDSAFAADTALSTDSVFAADGALSTDGAFIFDSTFPSDIIASAAIWSRFAAQSMVNSSRRFVKNSFEPRSSAPRANSANASKSQPSRPPRFDALPHTVSIEKLYGSTGSRPSTSKRSSMPSRNRSVSVICPM